MTPSLPPEGDMRVYNQRPSQNASTALVVAIIALASYIFCFLLPIPLILGIPAWLMARADLKQIDTGRMSPYQRGTLKAASIMGLIAVWSYLILATGSIAALTLISVPSNRLDWQPQDKNSIAIKDSLFTLEQGILLQIYAPEGVSEVWWENPYTEDDSKKVEQPEYWLCPGTKEGQVQVLILWTDEVGFVEIENIAVKSSNGYWAVEPSFSYGAALSDQEIEELKETGELIKPKPNAQPPERKKVKLWEYLMESL